MYQSRSERLHGKKPPQQEPEEEYVYTPIEITEEAHQEYEKSQQEQQFDKYLIQKFFVTGFGKDDGTATNKLYGQVANTANQYQLDIVKISRVTDDALNTKSLTAIFERRGM